MSAPNGKWCSHCHKDNHSDAECWSTRVVPNPPPGVYDIERMERALKGPSITLPSHLKTLAELDAFFLGANAAFQAMGEKP